MMMKKQILLFLMMLLPMVAMADIITVEIDGIYYNLISKGNVAEVTSNPNKYQGAVTIPESVMYESVEYSVTSIGDYAFRYCYDLTSVTIGNSVTSIGNRAFDGCSGLTSVTIPNSVTSIGQGAFFQCSGLTSVHISDLEAWCNISFSSPDFPDHHLFLNGVEIKDLVIPNSVTSIGDYAFQSCSGLTSVIIPNSVTSIGYAAFSNCTGLTSVTIPNSVTSIGDWAFHGCSGLISVTIPNSVTSIGYAAFSNCTGLTSITIPNSVTSIGYAAFSGCTGLTSITIGSGVRSISEKAFAECKNLEDVYCYAENVPNTNTNAFENSYVEYATLHVPDASLAAYSNTVPWSQFGTKVGLSGGSTEKCATPTISYGGKKLTFSCETEGVEYVYSIKDSDIKQGYDSEVQLTATYEISVYATKQGYENSDLATATLVWGSASFTETTGTTSATPLTFDAPVLIQSHNGTLTIQGADDGTQVNVYSINGTQAGSAVSRNGQATVNTNLQPGSVAIVKIGDRSVKVAIK